MKKKCSQCHQWKDVSEFYHDRSKKDGLKTYCMACEKLYKEEAQSRRAADELAKKRSIHHGQLPLDEDC